MAETSRSIAKKAGAAAVERALETLLPTIIERLSKIDDRIASMDREMTGQMRDLREHIDTRYEQLQTALNQLGERIARLEGRFEVFVNTVERQSVKMDQWIERLVKIEMTQDIKRKKRAS